VHCHTSGGFTKAEENRFLSGPRAGAGAAAANVFFSFMACGAATGGADFAPARVRNNSCRGGNLPPVEFYGKRKRRGRL